ncbi:MAG: hypothetical protein A2Z12_01995 [Actinobacteria bacterium RBG_16_68_21]|nr:MAG: hypothetical protein A2Z12_01995 [Actinobacteria bacterium RBG_16_68_21]
MGSTLDGRQFNALMRWSMRTVDADIDASRTTTSVTDITDLRRSRDAVSAADMRLRAFADSSPNAMVATGAAGRIILWNRAAVAMFGYEEAEALGMPVGRIMPDRFRTAHTEAMKHAETAPCSRVVNPARLVGLRRDGSEFPLDVSLGSWRVEDRIFHSAILQDKTSRALLEGEVTLRTAQLEELVRLKDQLIASVSHELRTPLTAIAGMADLLATHGHSLTEAEVDEMIATVASEAFYLSDIVDDLLVGARPASDDIAALIEQVDLTAETTMAIDRMWMGRKGHVRPVVNGSAIGSGDAFRTSQIIRNLVSNAIRHGGGLIHVEIAEAGPVARLSVHDSGTGVPEQVASRLFEPFVHTASPTRAPASVGLGLSISRRLARAMGGDLIYLREDGETIFTLTLPAAVGGAQPNANIGTRAA